MVLKMIFFNFRNMYIRSFDDTKKINNVPLVDTENIDTQLSSKSTPTNGKIWKPDTWDSCPEMVSLRED